MRASEAKAIVDSRYDRTANIDDVLDCVFAMVKDYARHRRNKIVDPLRDYNSDGSQGIVTDEIRDGIYRHLKSLGYEIGEQRVVCRFTGNPYTATTVSW